MHRTTFGGGQCEYTHLAHNPTIPNSPAVGMCGTLRAVDTKAFWR